MTTLLLLKVLGLYFLVSGVFVVTQQKTLGLVLKDMFAHRATTFLIGIALVLGGGALAFHTHPDANGAELLASIIAWIIVLKGIIYIFIPDTIYKMLKGISRSTFSTIGGLITIIGLYILFFVG